MVEKVSTSDASPRMRHDVRNPPTAKLCTVNSVTSC
ncbi:predicted protein [Sclerotinia sclerotiorum 1980 UF-70]|uniref:Uncharacterized protein n=1 Tax=Sclerotinia sclerotiorum (strain ATCC 18683 / 1980 / Ss-1) TaxID=665079 RepID=A7E475_SCLS1|nr:predicted protein [Sclerotinia sclerotiorum 1980 UF-70]EDN90697.1 predicted protein [Sclerotinia sclerotiorum 1980 UF-70]